MNSWILRRACHDDAAALVDCINRAYSVYGSRIPDLPAVSDGIDDDIANNVVWVAVRDDQVIGGLVLIEQDDHVILANVAVDPSATGQGLGRELLDLADSETLNRCKRSIRLSTHVAMPENVRLYEHLGWYEIGRLGNKVHMEKRL